MVFADDPPKRYTVNRKSRSTKISSELTSLMVEQSSSDVASALSLTSNVSQTLATHDQSLHSIEANRDNRGTSSEWGRAVKPRDPDNPASSSSNRLEPRVSEASTSSSKSNRGSYNNRSRGRGASRNRGGKTRGSGTRFVNSGRRGFGDELTLNTSENVIQNSLSRGAPETIPSQPVTFRPKISSSSVPPQRMVKSQAPDIATRTHEDIKNSQYECLICTNEVLPNSKIWDCKTCWSVLHLSCVSRWANNEVSKCVNSRNDNGEPVSSGKWRCPGCNLPKEELPTLYSCWCSKELEPHPVAGLPPHSCGQTCAKPRGNLCPHPCELICHAGPCLPCSHMGPPLSCFCGEKTITKKCIYTNYETGWSCENVCGKMLSCGKHKCRKKCHKEPCGSCELLIESSCYCAKVICDLPCFKLDNLKESRFNGKSWMGSFNCDSKCLRLFDCGNPQHFCKRTCHKQDDQPAHCPLAPDVINHCPCGKTQLSVLLEVPRKDCSAPIPLCQKECHNLLPCGHFCKDKCHHGECEPCQEISHILCRCGRVTVDLLCHEVNETPLCSRVCRTVLNCGRHECRNNCCPGEKKATERLASKRKHRSSILTPGINENFESEHICIKICSRQLKCGNHNCTSLCHKGPCPSCLEAIFDEISCACSRTVLQPPQPCGTIAPKCNFDCTRRTLCGHPEIKHQCHPDTEPCPKCPFLMQKACICGKKFLKNQPCWLTEVRCGLICGKKLKCGIHFCQKSCHRDGQCDDFNTACTQPCGRKKTVCEHTCVNRCHAPYPCKEVEPCQAKTSITCDCKLQKQQTKCLSSSTSSGNYKKNLPCNDECLKIQRNAKLADALKIDPKTLKDDHIPYSTMTIELYLNDRKFGEQYEQELRIFAADENKNSMRFKPMPAHQRKFIHCLAGDFYFDSKSQDGEPHRHVSIFKTPRSISAPMKTLNQCMQISIVKKMPTSTLSVLPASLEPWNAILLKNPRFGLTIDEIQTDLKFEIDSCGFEFHISPLPSENFVLRALTSKLNQQKVESILESKKFLLARKVSSSGLATGITLCSVDDSLKIVRREDKISRNDGWNQVAKGANSVKKVVSKMADKTNSFTVLGKVKKEKFEMLLEEEAPDDWEVEVEKWN